MQQADLQHLLSSKFRDLQPSSADTFAVKTTYPAIKALNWLHEKNILACPVCADTDEHEVVGLVDMVDLCTYAVLHSSVNQPQLETGLADIPVSTLMNYSGQNNLVILPEKASFSDVVKALSSPGVHRVCLKATEKSTISKIFDGGSVTPWLKQFVTQSSVVNFIADNLASFDSVLNETIEKSDVGSKSVFSVTTDKSMTDAFHVMVRQKVSGIAVVDDKTGVFVGNLAARDFCQMILAHPPIDLNSKTKDHTKSNSDYTCPSSTTLKDVVNLIKKNHIHRVYIVDKDGKPTGVVGLGDILNYISKFVPKSHKTKEDKATLSSERKINKDYTYKLGKSYSHYIRVSKEIIAVEPHTAAFDCFQILCKGGFSGLPVVEKNKSLVGLVDMADFTVYMIEKFLASETKDASFDSKLEYELKEIPVSKLINYSKINSCYPQPTDVKVRDLFRALSRPGVHRIPLVNTIADRFKFKLVEGFVTQSEAINFVAQHLLFFGSQVLNRKLSEIDSLGSQGVISVTEDNTALDAFQKLHASNISGMPVLDSKGHAVASISFRDFRFLLGSGGLEVSSELKLPLHEFIKKSKDLSDDSNRARIGLKRDHFSVAVLCRPTDTVIEVVNKLQLERTHRCYLVDADNKPTSVISLGDVLNYLVNTLPYPDALNDKEKEKRAETKKKQAKEHAEIESNLKA